MLLRPRNPRRRRPFQISFRPLGRRIGLARRRLGRRRRRIPQRRSSWHDGRPPELADARHVSLRSPSSPAKSRSPWRSPSFLLPTANGHWLALALLLSTSRPVRPRRTWHLPPSLAIPSAASSSQPLQPPSCALLLHPARLHAASQRPFSLLQLALGYLRLRSNLDFHRRSWTRPSRLPRPHRQQRRLQLQRQLRDRLGAPQLGLHASFGTRRPARELDVDAPFDGTWERRWLPCRSGG